MYSVLMSVYKKELPQNLKEAINSILKQSLPPTEIVVVKDGELTEELEIVIGEFKKKYSKLFKIVGYSQNRGLGYALNYGISHCSNELIARMDTDDIAEYSRCEEQFKCFINDKKLDVVGGIIEEFITDSKVFIGKRVVPIEHDDINKYMKTRCPFNHMTVMFKKSAVIKAGGYKELFCNEDYYLWIRMKEIGCRFLNLNKILVKVRITNETYKRRGGIKYFCSERYLQKYMLSKNMITHREYYRNLLIRVIVQLLIPNIFRSYIFKKFAREK